MFKKLNQLNLIAMIPFRFYYVPFYSEYIFFEFLNLRFTELPKLMNGYVTK